jgi:hypothetical protein
MKIEYLANYPAFVPTIGGEFGEGVWGALPEHAGEH